MTSSLILAAGKGLRLNPITKNVPKALTPFLGVSLLKRQIEVLEKSGIKRIHVVTGYLSEQIETLSHKLNFTTTFNANYNTSNMVNSMFSANEFIKNTKEDLIISYGDIIYEKKNLKKILTCNEDISVMIDLKWKNLWEKRMKNPLEDVETLILNNENFITELGKKTNDYSKIQGQYTGLIKIKHNVINDVLSFYYNLNKLKTFFEKKIDDLYMTDFLQLLINDGKKIKAVLVEGGWLEFDTLDDLNSYEQMNDTNLLKKFYKL